MDDQHRSIHNNPRFRRLVSERRRFAWILTVLVLGSFFSYLMIGILKPQWMMIPLYEGAVTTIGYPIGALLVVLAWVSTGIYIRRANNEFDPECVAILQESEK
jgi:uncharacterized membrane protein (DUF485 family)